MHRATASPILQLLRRVVEDGRVRELPDPDLLRRFSTEQDETAFYALLRRHGPMVLDVCRSVLVNEADAEDAFQATFLILTRKAGSIRKPASLGSWLHGVAHRTALKARAQSARRLERQASARERGAIEPDELAWREIREMLHEELRALAERYRTPLLLCYLEGKTQDEAAAQIGLPKGTLKGRLERARTLLRARLIRRGLGGSATLALAAWPGGHAQASLPGLLLRSTATAMVQFAAGKAPALVSSASVATLTEGVLKTMLLNKIKTVMAAMILIPGAIILGAGTLLPLAMSAGQANEETLAVPLSTLEKADHPKAAEAPKDQSLHLSMTAESGRVLIHGAMVRGESLDGDADRAILAPAHKLLILDAGGTRLARLRTEKNGKRNETKNQQICQCEEGGISVSHKDGRYEIAGINGQKAQQIEVTGQDSRLVIRSTIRSDDYALSAEADKATFDGDKMVLILEGRGENLVKAIVQRHKQTTELSGSRVLYAITTRELKVDNGAKRP